MKPKSASVVRISNISDRNRAKDVEHFLVILRTFTNVTSKYESRFGKNVRGGHNVCSREADARELTEVQFPRHHDDVR